MQRQWSLGSALSECFGTRGDTLAAPQRWHAVTSYHMAAGLCPLLAPLAESATLAGPFASSCQLPPGPTRPSRSGAPAVARKPPRRRACRPLHADMVSKRRLRMLQVLWFGVKHTRAACGWHPNCAERGCAGVGYRRCMVSPWVGGPIAWRREVAHRTCLSATLNLGRCFIQRRLPARAAPKHRSVAARQSTLRVVLRCNGLRPSPPAKRRISATYSVIGPVPPT